VSYVLFSGLDFLPKSTCLMRYSEPNGFVLRQWCAGVKTDGKWGLILSSGARLATRNDSTRSNMRRLHRLGRNAFPCIVSIFYRLQRLLQHASCPRCCAVAQAMYMQAGVAVFFEVKYDTGTWSINGHGCAGIVPTALTSVSTFHDDQRRPKTRHQPTEP
jgi:hypothetical protein